MSKCAIVQVMGLLKGMSTIKLFNGCKRLNHLYSDRRLWSLGFFKVACLIESRSGDRYLKLPPELVVLILATTETKGELICRLYIVDAYEYTLFIQ